MEEQTIFSETVNNKLYSGKGVTIATLLGGPLAGGYLIAKNFKALNQPEKIGRTWSYSIVVFILVIALAVIMPPQVPQILFVVLYAWMGRFAAQKLQGSLLDKHAAEGGKFYNNWNAAAVGFIIA